MKTSDIPWWQTFYDDHLADILLETTSKDEMRATTDFLVSQLDLPPKASVFDQCCGSGRLSWAMAELGFRVVGVDLIPGYIERARNKAALYPNVASPHFAAGDAMKYQTPNLCDGCFNWWTSFGYAADDEINLQMLQQAWRSLRPGGSYVLDFINVPGLYGNFQPQVVTRLQRTDGELVLIRESRLDLAEGVIHKNWDYLLPDGGRVRHETRVRLYDPPMLRKLFMLAGFNEIRFFGDTDGSPLTLNSRRCLVAARRPDVQ